MVESLAYLKAVRTKDNEVNRKIFEKGSQVRLDIILDDETLKKNEDFKFNVLYNKNLSSVHSYRELNEGAKTEFRSLFCTTAAEAANPKTANRKWFLIKEIVKEADGEFKVQVESRKPGGHYVFQLYVDMKDCLPML